MTYVTEQTSEELRAHMRRLQAMPGWHNPLDDRLWKEVQTLEAERDQLRAEVERLRKPLTDERICELWSWSATAEAERTATTQQHAFARAIEAAKEAK